MTKAPVTGNYIFTPAEVKRLQDFVSNAWVLSVNDYEGVMLDLVEDIKVAAEILEVTLVTEYEDDQ